MLVTSPLPGTCGRLKVDGRTYCTQGPGCSLPHAQAATLAAPTAPFMASPQSVSDLVDQRRARLLVELLKGSVDQRAEAASSPHLSASQALRLVKDRSDTVSEAAKKNPHLPRKAWEDAAEIGVISRQSLLTRYPDLITPTDLVGYPSLLALASPDLLADLDPEGFTTRELTALYENPSAPHALLLALKENLPPAVAQDHHAPYYRLVNPLTTLDEVIPHLTPDSTGLDILRSFLSAHPDLSAAEMHTLLASLPSENPYITMHLREAFATHPATPPEFLDDLARYALARRSLRYPHVGSRALSHPSLPEATLASAARSLLPEAVANPSLSSDLLAELSLVVELHEETLYHENTTAEVVLAATRSARELDLGLHAHQWATIYSAPAFSREALDLLPASVTPGVTPLRRLSLVERFATSPSQADVVLGLWEDFEGSPGELFTLADLV